MRYSLAVGLFFLVAAEVVGAEKPIPQDTVKIERRARERLAWFRRTTVGVYDNVGKKDPRWDDLARKTLDLAARQSGERGIFIPADEINKAAKAAIDAGCDDPLVINIYDRSTAATNVLKPEELIRRMKASALILAVSRYPALRRASAFEAAGTSTAGQKSPNEASKKEAEAHFEAALALLPESVKTDERNEFWEEKWFDYCTNLIRGYRSLGVDPPAALAKVEAALAKLPEMKALQLRIRGGFWEGYGWEARTNAFAPAVPAGGFELLEKRLGEAKKALEESWKLQPDNAWTATHLLDIDKSIGGDRDTMELWFDRAMKADGDRYAACLTKLDWLDPKWHGTPEEMLAFGRACRETKNWQAGITLLVGDAHNRFANLLPPAGRPKYLGSPAVWSEIKSVYDEYLEHYPLSNAARSKYAALAYMAAHYPEAHAQFEILGDSLTSWPNFPNYPLPTLQKIRAEVAQRVGPGAAAKKGARP